MSNATAKSWVTAPRYMHIESALRKYALETGIEIKTNVDKGWFQETIFWEASGSEDKIKQFRKDWNRFVEENC